MDKTENVLIERPAECPLRKLNHPSDKFYCVIILDRFKTIHCPSSTEFPAACQLTDKNITLMRGR
jgi:hypothetical protein